MIFLVFAAADGPHLGALVPGDRVLDLTAAWPGGPAPRDVAELAAAGDGAVEIARSLAGTTTPLGSVRLLAPIPRPRKNVFCVGRNYHEHIAEGDRAQGRSPTPPPDVPTFFTKAPSCVIGPGETIPAHRGITNQLDYEVELAAIIGRAGTDIPKSRALEHVFGWTIVNDVTGRDLQRRHGQWFKGKSLDRTCPMGPVVVHRSALPDASDLAIRLTVNGETRQESRTDQMIFDVPTIIEQLSRGMTLEPGDVIATGTPSGVGYAMDPPRFLGPGDMVRCEIERIGVLENTIGS